MEDQIKPSSEFLEKDSPAEVHRLEQKIEDQKDIVKDHFVALIHGLNGDSGDLYNIKLHLEANHPNVMAHCIKSNEAFSLTRDGIANGGERSAKEIKQIIEDNKSIKKFSVLGHSLGGMFARYAIGLLHDQGLFNNLEMMNFITMATPHLGSRRSNRSHWLNPFINRLINNAFSVTGQQLMLEDDDEQPLLLKMTEPESNYMKALQGFKKRVLYANVANDLSVFVSDCCHFTEKSIRQESVSKHELSCHRRSSRSHQTFRRDHFG
eukprot:TRINITY_DN8533_c0_g1_i1.p1 TRINITY_DN8533_c0_g1~~TRINITY_DN8533_c0_g1_i1.p1  ORF type:complete len:275 (-),score=59.31 TRINITY_DN8533_c0_g1_i1:212-1006(-)